MNAGTPTFEYRTGAPHCSSATLYPCLRAILERLRTQGAAGGRVTLFDIGCGNGDWVGHLDPALYNVVGLDISPSGVDIARKNFPAATFHTGSIYDFNEPALEGMFDIVTSVEVIEHLQYPLQMLRQSRRYLRPGGHLVLTTPYHGYMKNLVLSVFNLWDKHFSVAWEIGHIRFFSVRTLRSMVEEAGFKECTFHFAGRTPFLWKTMVCVCSA